MKEYLINGKILRVEVVVKKNNRYGYLRYRNGLITISTFKRPTEQEIITLLTKNFTKICQHQEQLGQKAKELRYFGKNYAYTLVKSEDDNVFFSGNEFVISVKSFDEKYVNKVIQAFYVEETRKYITPLLSKAYASYQSELTFSVSYRFKYLKTCYGKCVPMRHEITFSGMCAKLEPEEILYVIYHEFAHFKYLGHQKDFYDYLELHLNGAKSLKKRINSRK